MDFEWLLFDFDNTLVDFHDSSVKAFKRSFDKHELSISEEAYATYKKINKKIWDKFEKGEITTDDIRKDRFSQLFEALKINHIDPIKFNASYIEDIIFYTELYPGALSLLKRLKEKYKLAIVTNGLKEAQRARIEKVGITELFETIVVSDEIGSAKPDQAYFEYTHTKIGEPSKEEVLVIGDNLKSDIIGANDFGYKSCWISEKEESKTIKPDFIIKDVNKLYTILNVYNNVACSFYDELELHAVQGNKIRLDFINESGLKEVTHTKIKNLETHNKEEFLITQEGLKIRLDKINNLAID